MKIKNVFNTFLCKVHKQLKLSGIKKKKKQFQGFENVIPTAFYVLDYIVFIKSIDLPTYMQFFSTVYRTIKSYNLLLFCPKFKFKSAKLFTVFLLHLKFLKEYLILVLIVAV